MRVVGVAEVRRARMADQTKRHDVASRDARCRAADGAVHHRVDGGVATDDERDEQSGRRAQARRLRQDAKPVANVIPPSLQHRRYRSLTLSNASYVDMSE